MFVMCDASTFIESCACILTHPLSYLVSTPDEDQIMRPGPWAAGPCNKVEAAAGGVPRSHASKRAVAALCLPAPYRFLSSNSATNRSCTCPVLSFLEKYHLTGIICNPNQRSRSGLCFVDHRQPRIAKG